MNVARNPAIPKVSIAVAAAALVVRLGSPASTSPPNWSHQPPRTPLA